MSAALLQYLNHQRHFVDVSDPVVHLFARWMYCFSMLMVRTNYKLGFTVLTLHSSSGCRLSLRTCSTQLRRWIFAQLLVQAYDYALTVHLEVNLVWRSAWSYTKVLFLLTRYLPVVYGVIIIHGTSVSFVQKITAESCTRPNGAQCFFGLLYL